MSPGARAAHRWAAFGASVRGSAHVREARPNEDAVACRSDPDGRWAVVAVADGHGHTLAVRADLGSSLAVEVAVTSARSCWEHLGGQDDDVTGAEIAARMPQALTDGWLAAVRHDLATSPLSEAELVTSGNPDALASHPELAYGTTLIVTMAAANSLVACQIGDGDLLGVTRNGSIFRPLRSDSRLVGTRTTSLASRTAPADLRSTQVDVDATQIEVVVAASDGYVNSFSADDGFATAGRDLWKLLHELGPSPVEKALPGWLESTSTDGTGDDSTLAILFDQGRLTGNGTDR
jgi:hypothetical protein